MRRCGHAGVVDAAVVVGIMVVAVARMFGAPTIALARDFELSVSGGATQLYIDEEGGDEVLNDQWGPWVATSFSLAPIADTPQFRLGGGVGFSWTSGTVDNEFITGDLDLFLITPELLVSWRQPLGADDSHWYVEPGVGVGPAIGTLWFVGTEWGYGYSVRPFLRAGYETEKWSAGLEASYRFAHLNFDDGDSDIENLGVGVFAAWKL
jgi:hypothetical protein